MKTNINIKLRFYESCLSHGMQEYCFYVKNSDRYNETSSQNISKPKTICSQRHCWWFGKQQSMVNLKKVSRQKCSSEPVFYAIFGRAHENHKVCDFASKKIWIFHFREMVNCEQFVRLPSSRISYLQATFHSRRFVLYINVTIKTTFSDIPPHICAFNFEDQNKIWTVFCCVISERLNKLRARKIVVRFQYNLITVPVENWILELVRKNNVFTSWLKTPWILLSRIISLLEGSVLSRVLFIYFNFLTVCVHFSVFFDIVLPLDDCEKHVTVIFWSVSPDWKNFKWALPFGKTLWLAINEQSFFF